MTQTGELMRFTIPANMAGVPALSVPVGHSSGGVQHLVLCFLGFDHHCLPLAEQAHQVCRCWYLLRGVYRIDAWKCADAVGEAVTAMQQACQCRLGTSQECSTTPVERPLEEGAADADRGLCLRQACRSGCS